jgi:segregation and condensation protein B
MEKGLIKMMGRKDLPGRPIIYGTTQAFLELFGLNSLVDLPTLKEIQPPPAVEELETVEKEISGEGEIRNPADAIREAAEGSQESTEGAVPVNEASDPQGEASAVEDRPRLEDKPE